jgi:cytochrome c553
MAPLARMLTEQQIADVSAYYASVVASATRAR